MKHYAAPQGPVKRPELSTQQAMNPSLIPDHAVTKADATANSSNTVQNIKMKECMEENIVYAPDVSNHGKNSRAYVPLSLKSVDVSEIYMNAEITNNFPVAPGCTVSFPLETTVDITNYSDETSRQKETGIHYDVENWNSTLSTYPIEESGMDTYAENKKPRLQNVDDVNVSSALKDSICSPDCRIVHNMAHKADESNIDHRIISFPTYPQPMFSVVFDTKIDHDDDFQLVNDSSGPEENKINILTQTDQHRSGDEIFNFSGNSETINGIILETKKNDDVVLKLVTDSNCSPKSSYRNFVTPAEDQYNVGNRTTALIATTNTISEAKKDNKQVVKVIIDLEPSLKSATDTFMPSTAPLVPPLDLLAMEEMNHQPHLHAEEDPPWCRKCTQNSKLCSTGALSGYVECKTNIDKRADLDRSLFSKCCPEGLKLSKINK